MSLKLVKEPDNEFDKNAIVVYAEEKRLVMWQIINIPNLN